MKHPFAIPFFCLILCASAFPQEKGITRCDNEMKRIPVVTQPGSAYAIEQLSCDQAVSIIGLEKGYFRIQLGNSIGYVYAKYVRMLESQTQQAPQQIQQPPAQTKTIEAPPAAVQRAVLMSDEFPRVEVFGGYAMLRPNLPGDLVPGSPAESELVETAGEFALGNVLGWAGSVTVNLNRFMGITADLNGFYKGLDVDYEGTSVDASGSLHTFLFGPTFKMRNSRVQPFFRALFGLGRVSGSINVDGDLVDGSKTGFAAKVGGGVDIVVHRNVSFRAIEADYFPYRQSNGEVFTFNNIRWGSGLVFCF